MTINLDTLITDILTSRFEPKDYLKSKIEDYEFLKFVSNAKNMAAIEAKLSPESDYYQESVSPKMAANISRVENLKKILEKVTKSEDFSEWMEVAGKYNKLTLSVKEHENDEKDMKQYYLDNSFYSDLAQSRVGQSGALQRYEQSKNDAEEARQLLAAFEPTLKGPKRHILADIDAVEIAQGRQ